MPIKVFHLPEMDDVVCSEEARRTAVIEVVFRDLEHRDMGEWKASLGMMTDDERKRVAGEAEKISVMRRSPLRGTFYVGVIRKLHIYSHLDPVHYVPHLAEARFYLFRKSSVPYAKALAVACSVMGS